jgi:hypothetical protein
MSEQLGPDNEHAAFTSPINVPEVAPLPTMQDQIVDLVDSTGKVDTSGEIKSDVFYVPDNDTGDGKYHSLIIRAPEEGSAEKISLASRTYIQ